MNKTELVDSIQEILGEGATKKCAEQALNAVLAAITEATLKKGDKVQLVGFGTFAMKTRSARTGRNPQTGAEMKIPASSTLTFKASSSTFKKVEKPAAKKPAAKKATAAKKPAAKKPAKKK